ncbi:glutelin type-D 1-like isoform X1 [Apium graveolens]
MSKPNLNVCANPCHLVLILCMIIGSCYGELEKKIDLSPKFAKKVFGGDGGYYYSWFPNELAMLEKANVGAAKLRLEKYGFLLPHYSDSPKVAYVLRGKGVAGIVLPAKEEKVLPIKTGDAIALPFGVVTWWYNKDDSELEILFLGETSKGHKVGTFTNFFLTGSNGIFTGFSTEFVGRAWDLDQSVVRMMVHNQTSKGIVKLGSSIKMTEPREEHREGLVLNCLEAPLNVDVKNGGRSVVLNTTNLPLVSEVGLGADLVRLDGGAMVSPGFSCDSAYQVTHIIRGSGRAQIVGIDGKRVLETRVEAGNLFIVPRFFVVSKIADPEGLEWFSIMSTPAPIFTNLAGSNGAWKALSPRVIQASFNVGDDTEKQFRSKRASEAVFFPPPK